MERQKKFLKAFKQEHEYLLQHLLDLRTAVRNVDAPAVARLTREMDEVMGPHFRVEEEGLYPMLGDYLGAENVRDLLDEHVGAVEAMHEFRRHAGDAKWLEQEGARTISAILDAMMMHVTSCDGLSIVVDRFSDEQQEVLAGHLDRVQAEPMPLTQWRPAPAPAAH